MVKDSFLPYTLCMAAHMVWNILNACICSCTCDCKVDSFLHRVCCNCDS